jgi:hypothetical protein
MRTRPAAPASAVAARDGWRSDALVTTDQALEALRDGELRVVGRLVDASNASLYCELRLPRPLEGGTTSLHAMYKPVGGERPLDDFPVATLARREVAAWLLSEATGWRIVPPTVLRDGPFGEGMVQLWVDVDPRVDVLSLILTRDERLRPMALFDVLANNADRKGGHVLPTPDGELVGCDHGICFAAQPKLRTVLWGWGGDRLLPNERATLEQVVSALDGDLGRRLMALLATDEVESLRARAEGLLRADRLPEPHPRRRNVPWPPF